MVKATICLSVLLMCPLAYSQQLLFVDHDAAWGNTGFQQTPPAAFIMSAGACVESNDCNFSSGAGMLNPLTFYPSTHTQTVTITSGWGQAYTAFAQVFARGGNIGWSVPRVLTNDGQVPPNFFQSNQSDGGSHVFNPATVTSVEVVLAPFTFQETASGYWEAVGSDGNPPQMLVRVYGSYQ